MRGGYFLVYRKLFDPSSRWHPSRTGEPACKGFAWLDLVSMARFEPSDGLERGQLYVSVRALASRWNWGRTKTSEFLNELADANAVTKRTQSGRKASVLTICNYDTYQGAPGTERTQSGHKADASAVAKRTRRSNKEGKQEPTTWLTPFWDAWVERYGGKPSAGQLASALKPLVDEHGSEEVLRRWNAYLQDTSGKYVSPQRFAQTWAEWGNNDGESIPDLREVWK